MLNYFMLEFRLAAGKYSDINPMDCTRSSEGSFNNYVDHLLTPLEWTIVNILHTTYPFFTWPSVDFLLTTYLPLLVHIIIEWPMSVLTNTLILKATDGKIFSKNVKKKVPTWPLNLRGWSAILSHIHFPKTFSIVL